MSTVPDNITLNESSQSPEDKSNQIVEPSSPPQPSPIIINEDNNNKQQPQSPTQPQQPKMVTITQTEYELLQSNASQAVISTLRVIKKFNTINDSLINLTAFVANLREEVFSDLNLPDPISNKK